MAWTARPFVGQDVNSEAQQRAYYSHLGDGIINATSMLAGRLTADGTQVLRFQPCDVKMRGFYTTESVETTFNLAALGTAPPNGQSRLDRLVMRLDSGAKTIAPAVLTGVPAASPSFPAMKWGEGGIWELGLWTWQYTGVGLAQAAMVDRRTWLGPHLVLADDANLPTTATIGSTASRRGRHFVFRPTGVNTAGWVDTGATRQLTSTTHAFTGAKYQAGAPLIRQTFYAEPQISNTSGGWTLNYPEAFPNGVISLAVTLANTVTNVPNAAQVFVAPVRANCNLTEVNGIARANFTGTAVPAGQYVSVTIDALGW